MFVKVHMVSFFGKSYSFRWIIASTLFCFVSLKSMLKNAKKKKKIFFQVLFTTTRFSSVLSCEDLLISKCPMSYNQTVFVSLTIKADIATIQLQRDMFLALSAFNSKTI